MSDLRAMAERMVAVADEMEILRRQVHILEDELHQERQVAQRIAKEANQYEHELRSVQQVLLQEGAAPDEMEAEGTAVVLVRILRALDAARHAVAR
jgi:predicted transcriptional regulator